MVQLDVYLPNYLLHACTYSLLPGYSADWVTGSLRQSGAHHLLETARNSPAFSILHDSPKPLAM